MININKETLVSKIICFNHAWKLAQTNFGEESPIATSLRDQKSCLQADLLRNHHGVYLALDSEVESDEEVYSVKLENQIYIDMFGHRNDAEHLPKRVAEKLFSGKELYKLIRE